MSGSAAPILVTGATGRHGSTGAHVARRLREEGRPVRILARTRSERTDKLAELGAEVVIGDLHDRRSLVTALTDIELAYFTYPVEAGVVPAAANYTATGLTNGTTYYFVVSALNSAGESSNSVSASAQPVSASPPQLGFVAANNQVQINWPADHLGWSLQVQTNSLTAGIGSNWVTVPSSSLTNQMTMPIDPANGSVFYRLIYP